MDLVIGNPQQRTVMNFEFEPNENTAESEVIRQRYIAYYSALEEGIGKCGMHVARMPTVMERFHQLFSLTYDARSINATLENFNTILLPQYEWVLWVNVDWAYDQDSFFQLARTSDFIWFLDTDGFNWVTATHKHRTTPKRYLWCSENRRDGEMEDVIRESGMIFVKDELPFVEE